VLTQHPDTLSHHPKVLTRRRKLFPRQQEFLSPMQELLPPPLYLLTSPGKKEERKRGRAEERIKHSVKISVICGLKFFFFAFFAAILAKAFP
jgi:hypothetical protein